MGSFNLTLFGSRPSSSYEQATQIGGDKSLSVFNGGLLSLNGKKQVSWTRLAVTAKPGDKVINVKDDMDWKAGDELVIATSHPFNKESNSLALTTNEV